MLVRTSIDMMRGVVDSGQVGSMHARARHVAGHLLAGDIVRGRRLLR